MVKRKQVSINSFFFAMFIVILMANFSVSAANQDPFEPVNRVVFTFNDFLDKWLLKPAATAYKAVMPEFAEKGVRNFFGNLGEVRNLVHNTLQGKLDGSAKSTGRFLINSTVGIGGLFDVASKIGIPLEREDLGQTLGSWGINSGPYLVLPFVGPSSLRDGLGIVVDPFFSPMTYAPLDLYQRAGTATLSGVQTRADLIAAESLIMGDPYLLFRQAYLSKREFDVDDGIVTSDDFLDSDPNENWDDEEFVDEEF